MPDEFVRKIGKNFISLHERLEKSNKALRSSLFYHVFLLGCVGFPGPYRLSNKLIFKTKGRQSFISATFYSV